MASVQISIKDENSARQWLEMVEEINEDYHEAMKDAADCLQNMQEFGEGTLVDELVNFGDAMLTAADKTFDTINQIANTVTSILGSVKDFAEDVVNGIKGVAKMFG